MCVNGVLYKWLWVKSRIEKCYLRSIKHKYEQIYVNEWDIPGQRCEEDSLFKRASHVLCRDEVTCQMDDHLSCTRESGLCGRVVDWNHSENNAYDSPLGGFQIASRGLRNDYLVYWDKNFLLGKNSKDCKWLANPSIAHRLLIRSQ